MSNIKLISRAELAKMIGIKENTLAVWAVNKRYDLPYVKIGSRAMYRVKDVEQFIDDNLIENNNNLDL